MGKAKKTSRTAAADERKAKQAGVPDCLSGLTTREAKFVLALMFNGGRQGQAAVDSGYSAASASVAAYQLLKKPHILKARRELLAAMVTPERLVETIAAFAFKNDLADYVPQLALMRDKGLDTRLVKKVKFNDDGSLAEIEMHSPQKAHGQLMTALGVGKGPAEDINVTIPQITNNFVENLQIRLDSAGDVRYHPDLPPLNEVLARSASVTEDREVKEDEQAGMDGQSAQNHDQEGGAGRVLAERCADGGVSGDGGTAGAGPAGTAHHLEGEAAGDLDGD